MCVQQQCIRQKTFISDEIWIMNFRTGEEVTITPRNYPFSFLVSGERKQHYAMIGMAHVADDYPLYYDAINEKGLGMAGLNFSGKCGVWRTCFGKERRNGRGT